MKKIFVLFFCLFPLVFVGNVYAEDRVNTDAYAEIIEKIGADKNTFELINPILYKDKDYVYTYDGKVEGIDAATFIPVGKDYYKDKDHIYYSPYSNFDIVDGVDIVSFTTLGKEDDLYSGYAKDNKSLFLEGKKLEILGVDLASFEQIIADAHGHLGKDKNKIYLGDTPILLARFFKQAISSHCLINNKEEVFCYDQDKEKYLVAKTDSSFKKIGKHLYADKSNIYNFLLSRNKDKIIISNDAQNFQILNNNYAKDSQNVFYSTSEMYNKTIKGVDVATFEVFSDETDMHYFGELNYAKDKNNVYYNGEIVEGENPETFNPIEKIKETQNNLRNNIYFFLLGAFLLDFIIMFFVYWVIIKNKKIQFAFYKKFLLVLIPVLIVHLLLYFMDISVHYFIYITVIGFLIFGVTKKVFPENINILKDPIFYALAVILLKIIITIIITMIIGIIGGAVFMSKLGI